MADQSMKNTNLQPSNTAGGNANPHQHIENVDITKEQQPKPNDVIRTDTDKVNQTPANQNQEGIQR